MPDNPDVSHISLKIDGAAASEELMSNLLEVTVDNSVHMPSMFTLRLYSHDMKWLEDETLREGKKVDIFLGEGCGTQLISGKIACLEPDLDATQPALLVRGYDLSHKLYRGRKRRAFAQSTIGDIVRSMAGEAGLSAGTVDDPGTVYEYIFQNNQTNAEFLLEWARRVGREFFFQDNKLHFRKPGTSSSVITLEWGQDLLSFRPRLSTAEQVDEVEVRGWNVAKKEAVVGTAKTGADPTSTGIAGTAQNIGKTTWGEAKIAILDEMVSSAKEAETIAQAALDELTTTFVEADGICRANPKIVPGKKIQIDGAGSRFNGNYYVTQAIHVWTNEQDALTHFTVTGKRDRNVWSLLEDTTMRRDGMNPVIGLVTNNKDPNEWGRVKVKFPWLDDQIESNWARIVSPMGGAQRGLLYLPEVDDEVLVGFEDGDIHRPFVLGGLWNGKDKLPLNQAEAVGNDGKVNKRILKTRAAHTLTFDDTDKKENVELKTKSGHSLRFDDEPSNEKITVKSKSGHTIIIDDASSGPKITVKSKAGHTLTFDDSPGSESILLVDKNNSNKIQIKSIDNSMLLSATGNITIEAQGKLSMKGTAGVEVDTPAQLKMSGKAGAELTTTAQLKMSGTAGAELSSTALATVKGSMLQLEGTGPASLKGNPVAIN